MTYTLRPPRGRLAPSPTGNLHLGNAFAFLMAWLSMRKQGGSLVLRMEDIDPDRSRPAFAESIIADLTWLGITWEEGPDKDVSGSFSNFQNRHGDSFCGPYTQSQRLDRYESILAELQQRGLVYPCYCTRKELRSLASAPHIGDEGVPYPGTCRTLSGAEREAFVRMGRRPSFRLNTEAAAQVLLAQGLESPDSGMLRFSFTDGVLGPQTFTMADCGGDFPLRRSDGVFAYQLAVVADDAAMGITEVVRGDDLLLSTPRQILLFRLLNHTPPAYAHVPLLHDAQGERLAKRHKGLELAALRDAGISPQAVTGYLGWLAGFLPQPRPVAPAELVPAFSLAALRGRRMQLQENVVEFLRKL